MLMSEIYVDVRKYPDGWDEIYLGLKWKCKIYHPEGQIYFGLKWKLKTYHPEGQNISRIQRSEIPVLERPNLCFCVLRNLNYQNSYLGILHFQQDIFWEPQFPQIMFRESSKHIFMLLIFLCKPFLCFAENQKSEQKEKQEKIRTCIWHPV